jgi:hypothetical protein
VRPDDIRRWLRRSPFAPFTIHMTDATIYPVRHPDWASVGRSTLVVGVFSEQGPERHIEIALLHITRLEPILSPADVSANGA